jgi:hypothetical protein
VRAAQPLARTKNAIDGKKQAAENRSHQHAARDPRERREAFVLRGSIADPAADAHRQYGVVSHRHSLFQSSIPTIAGVKGGFKLTESISVKDVTFARFGSHFGPSAKR